jgi:carboxypeptidase C (cathepsin A)
VARLTPHSALPPRDRAVNGGPGCDSLEGAFAELGNLLIASPAPAEGSPLVFNPFAWSNEANVVFIEAPACVGFSYAETLDGCAHNDTTTAADNLAALDVFFSCAAPPPGLLSIAY